MALEERDGKSVYVYSYEDMGKVNDNLLFVRAVCEVLANLDTEMDVDLSAINTMALEAKLRVEEVINMLEV